LGHAGHFRAPRFHEEDSGAVPWAGGGARGSRAIAVTLSSAISAPPQDNTIEIHEGLQVIETWNSANDFILYGKGGEFASNKLEDQEILIGSPRARQFPHERKPRQSTSIQAPTSVASEGHHRCFHVAMAEQPLDRVNVVVSACGVSS